MLAGSHQALQILSERGFFWPHATGDSNQRFVIREKMLSF